MGVREFSWKEFWRHSRKIIIEIITLIGLVSAIIGIVTKWNIVSNWLSSIGNFFLKIFNLVVDPIVRDVLLFLLIVGILIWVFLINKKLKKLPKAYEEILKIHLEKKPKKEEKPKRKEEPKLTEEHFRILAHIANASDSLGEHALFNLHKSKYPNSFRVELKSIISDLLEADLIRRAGAIGSELLYDATGKGVKITDKILKKGKK